MNHITIQPTIFKDHPHGNSTYGYRMYDDYDQMYDNSWKSIPDNNLDILRQALKNDSDTAKDMFGFILQERCGIYIGNVWYGWEEIKHLFN